MSGKKKKNWLSPERREPGGFAALPHCLLESKVYIGLPWETWLRYARIAHLS